MEAEMREPSPGGGVESRHPQHLEGVDLPTEIVSSLMAEVAFTAIARILARTFETERRLLDILA